MHMDAPAWGMARVEAERAGVEVASLQEMREAYEVTDVVRSVWGEDVLDPALVKALGHAGCVLCGARSSDGRLIGFVLGFLGWDQGLHVHSHMLAVLPSWQGRGIGYALKLAQRAACLDHGVEEVRWTYDPLVARNARFNLVKLGAVATRWLGNFYGEMRDVLNRGDRSDRFEVRWPLASARVEGALSGSGSPPRPGPLLLDVEWGPNGPSPKSTGAGAAAGARVRIPLDHLAIRSRDPELGRRWRECSAEAFERCLAAGLAAVWISKEGEYVFDRPGGGG